LLLLIVIAAVYLESKTSNLTSYTRASKALNRLSVFPDP